MYQKFIITDEGMLLFGNVYLHRDLLPAYNDTCYGGGLWRVDHERKMILLYGRSFDFGGPDFTMLRSVDRDGIGGCAYPIFYLPMWPHEEPMELVFE